MFSENRIKYADVFINNNHIGKAYRANDTQIPLFLIKWNPSQYLNNIHKIRVVVEVNSLLI